MVTRDASPEETAAYARAWYSQNKPTVLNRAAQWYRDNRNRKQASRRARYADTQKLVLAAYGDKCACCGETNPDFLTLDHVDGGGNAHRRATSTDMWSWARHNDFPDLLQLLCYNCNGAKGRGKECHG